MGMKTSPFPDIFPCWTSVKIRLCLYKFLEGDEYNLEVQVDQWRDGFSPKTTFRVGNFDYPKLRIYCNSLWLPGQQYTSLRNTIADKQSICLCQNLQPNFRLFSWFLAALIPCEFCNSWVGSQHWCGWQGTIPWTPFQHRSRWISKFLVKCCQVITCCQRWRETTENMWAMKKTLVRWVIWAIILPRYIGIIINHYKDPY